MDNSTKSATVRYGRVSIFQNQILQKLFDVDNSDCISRHDVGIL